MDGATPEMEDAAMAEGQSQLEVRGGGETLLLSS